MQTHVMAAVAAKNDGLIVRCISLTKILWFGVSWLRGSFTALFCLWVLVYLVDYATASVQIVASVMVAPIMLQTLLGMYVAIRAGQLLMNSQLHLVGVRKEIFLSCFTLCLVFVVFVYDPKNSDYLLHAKLIMFAVFSFASFWLFWMYCLQIAPMIVVMAMVAGAVGLGFVVGVKTAFVIFDVVLWGYFAYWLWRSPLQRQFKFESFVGLVDYCVERLKIDSLKRALTKANNKEHVLLMGEGDGYLNRIILAPIFSVAFTGFYIVAMQHWRELSLWLILLLLGGTKAKVKVTQSAAKLWLLNASDRAGQFQVTENISLRLNLYQFITASLLLMIWLIINPDFLVNGIAALCLSFLFVTLVDYYSGLLFSSNKAPFIVLLFAKMAFMLAVTFARFDSTWYVLIAVVLLMLCIFFRERAKRNFLVANLSVRAS